MAEKTLLDLQVFISSCEFSIAERDRVDLYAIECAKYFVEFLPDYKGGISEVSKLTFDELIASGQILFEKMKKEDYEIKIKNCYNIFATIFQKKYNELK